MTASTEPVLDTAVLIDLRAIDADEPDQFVSHFVLLFLTETRALITMAQRACAENDRGAVERSAHAICGSAGFIGARRLATIASVVERAAPERPMSELVHLVGLLDAAFEELEPALHEVTQSGV